MAAAVDVHRLYKQMFNVTHNKVIAMARNYGSHVDEIGEKAPAKPLFFDKPIGSCINQSGSVMYLKSDNVIHYEVEMGIIIGLKAKNIKPEDYLDYIEGYFVGIDFTDRTLQSRFKKNGSPWIMSKG